MFSRKERLFWCEIELEATIIIIARLERVNEGKKTAESSIGMMHEVVVVVLPPPEARKDIIIIRRPTDRPTDWLAGCLRTKLNYSPSRKVYLNVFL